MGIECDGAERDTGINKLLRVDGVRGEKEILGGAVGQLLGERCRGAEGGDEVDSRSVLVSVGERRHDGLEVGGAGQLQLLLRRETGDGNGNR